MRSKTWTILAVCVMALVAVDLATSRAQDPFGQPQEPPRPPEPTINVPGGLRRIVDNPGAESPMSTMQEIEATGHAFRDAEGVGAKSEARKKLVELLEKYFDEDMKTRATELEKVEARVKKLRTLLDKRASKKQEIVDLQVKVLENEADGLGFFNNAAPQVYYQSAPGMLMVPGAGGRFQEPGVAGVSGDVFGAEPGPGSPGGLRNAPVDQPPLQPQPNVTPN